MLISKNIYKSIKYAFKACQAYKALILKMPFVG